MATKAKKTAPRKATAAKKAPKKKGPAKSSAKAARAVEITGYSGSFSFDEALRDALTQARDRFPSPPRNPDVGVRVDFKSAWAVTGGNMRIGLFVTVTAK